LKYKKESGHKKPRLKEFLKENGSFGQTKKRSRK